MNVDWGPVIIVGGLGGSIGAGIWLAGHIDKGRQRVAAAMRREQNLYAPYVRQEADSIPVGDGMPNIAMRTGMAWPGDLCAYPPCDLEDGWICTWHDPRAQSLRYGPEPVIGRCEWSAEMERQVATHAYVRWDHCDDCYAQFERLWNEAAQ